MICPCRWRPPPASMHLLCTCNEHRLLWAFVCRDPLDMRATRCASAPAGLQLIACFSQEAKGWWVCRAHIKVRCLRNRTPNLPATCTRAITPHGGASAPAAPRPLQQHLYLPEVITHPAPLKKTFSAHTLRLCACFPKINWERYVIGKLHSCFFFLMPEKTVVISPGLMWWPVCGEDLCVISGFHGVTQELLWLAKHTKTGYWAQQRFNQHIFTLNLPHVSQGDHIKHGTLLWLILSFQFFFFLIHKWTVENGFNLPHARNAAELEHDDARCCSMFQANPPKRAAQTKGSLKLKKKKRTPTSRGLALLHQLKTFRIYRFHVG